MGNEISVSGIERGDRAEGARANTRQTCISRDVTIVQGSIGKDHVHILVSSPPTMAPSKLVQYIKRTIIEIDPG